MSSNVNSFEDDEEICGIYQHRINPDKSSPFIHQYQVKRSNRREIEWESMEDILEIDHQFPMKQFCADSLVTEYHEYIMEFAKKTAEREQNEINKSPKNNKKHKHKNKNNDNGCDHIFAPSFDVESILDEKQEPDDDIQFKIRWRGWPKQYDSWTYESCIGPYSLTLVDQFRRNNDSNSNNKCGKNLGRKGFASTYWKQLYAAEWQQFMDGMDNGPQHADYAYYFFKKYGLHKSIEHIADFGFGTGNMLDSFVKKFRPKIAYGLEPSLYAFDKYTTNFVKQLKINKSYFSQCHAHFECVDLIEYFQRESMTEKEVKIYNKKYHQRKKRKREEIKNGDKRKKKKIKKTEDDKDDKDMAMDIEGDDNDDVDMEQDVNHQNKNENEMKEIMSDAHYKQFCFCSRGKNRNWYQRKQDKFDKKSSKNNKNRMKNSKLVENIYDEFPCSCYSKFDGSYNLGLCVSVLQYLNDKDVETVLEGLSKQCDFLYFDVCTSEEYEIMRNGSTFKDKWAISRPRKWYLSIIFKHWRIISNEILESKFFYPDNTSSNIPNTIYVFNDLQ